MSSRPGTLLDVDRALTVPETLARQMGRIPSAVLRQQLLRLIFQRLVMASVLLFVVSALSFVLVSLTPGDAASQILGINATPAQYAELRQQLGLNLPLYEQYARWAGHALTGNLGTSVFTGEPVNYILNQRLPVTLSLMLGSLIVSVSTGVAIGVFSAIRGGISGRIADAVALIGFALPSFWVGAILISFFAVRYRWFPATGYVPFTQSPYQWAQSLALPVVALSIAGIASIAKQGREAMLDVLGTEYIRVARANAVRMRSIVFRHALKNAAVRIITVLGVQAVGLLGGTVLIENVFAIPGLGSEAVTGTAQHDLPVVEGTVVYFTIIVVVINLLVDLAYTWLNPKVHLQ
jgi:peptide/nickel transport system permease protein